MAQVSKPYTFSNQTTADANQVDQDFDTLYNLVNGGLDDSNMKANSLSAAIATEGVAPSQTKGIPYATDLFGSTGFVETGLVVSKDGTNANQVNITAGVVWLLEAGGILRRFAPSATNFKTTSATQTFYLDLNPDETWSWGTTHSSQSNYITIATVTSDASSNVNVITDTRTFGGVQIYNNGTAYPASTSATATTTALRDSNGNVASQYPVSTSQNPNLLFNPTARQKLSGWTMVSGTWSAQFGSNGEGGYFQSPNVASSGAYITLESQHIPINASDTITVSGEVDTSSLTAGQAWIEVDWYNASNSVISAPQVQPQNTGVTWAKVSATLTAPANTSYCTIRCVLSATALGTGKFRKIKVESGSVATTFSDDNTLNTVQYQSALQSAIGPTFHGEMSTMVFYASNTLLTSTVTSASAANTTPGAWEYVAANWSGIQGFILEVAGYATSGGTAYFGLWDVTAGAVVSGSQVSTTTATSTNVVRSGTIPLANLTDGHTHCVALWTSSSSYGANMKSSNLKSVF